MGTAVDTPEVLEKGLSVAPRQPLDPEHPQCYYCDPYGYRGLRYPGAHASVCWDHAQMNVNPKLPDVGLPSGKRASWKRGVWA